MSADALPTVQQNGVVWAEVTVGNTVYATGKFSETYPAGAPKNAANQTPRANLLAFDITTGNLITSFNHALNAQGLAIAASPDGSRVYVAGDFTTVDGQTRNHIAAFDTVDGALDPNFRPSISGQTRAISATISTVYVGGNFFSVNGVARTRLAAFAASNGSLLSWAPAANDNMVTAMVVTPDQSEVVIGGRFLNLNGLANYGLGAVNAVTGALVPYAANQLIHDYSPGTPGAGAGIESLATDGTQVYASGFVWMAGQAGKFEGNAGFDPDTGRINFINDCHGDTYDVMPIGDVLYTVSHNHDCSAIGDFPDAPARHHALAFTTFPTGANRGPDAFGWNYNGVPDSTLLHWYPSLGIGTVTGQNQAAWAVTGNANYIALGGEFPSVNGDSNQTGLVRFAISTIAPNRTGPLASSTLTPSAVSRSSGTAHVSWQATWDYDNENLTYNVYRDGGATPVFTVNANSNFWQLPTMGFTDTGLTPGSTYKYQVKVSDSFNNTRSGGTTSVTITSTTPPNQPPTAAFGSSCTQLTCDLDGSASSDGDGTIASYAWDFGDGTTGSATTPSHTYVTAGTYNVTLTVTDNGGATNSVTHQVVPTSQHGAAFASDDFGRTVSNGWGTADLGGAWSSVGTPSVASVAGGAGQLNLASSNQTEMYLGGVSVTNSDVLVGVTPSVRPVGGSIFVSVFARRTAGTTGYTGRVLLNPDGSVTLSVNRVVRNTTTVLDTTKLTGITYSPGATVDVRVEASGTSPTIVRARTWLASTTEPSTWQLTATDNTAALQNPGSVGVIGYLSFAVTNGPVALGFTGFRGQPPIGP